LKIHIKNYTGNTIDFCFGEKEYVLEHNEEVEVEARDEDCMYIDEAYAAFEGRRTKEVDK